MLEREWAECFSSGGDSPTWVLVELEGAGHSPIVERPEETAEAYLGFLAGLG